jgi:hypothetical protein
VTRTKRSPRGAFAPLGVLALFVYLGVGGSCSTSSTPYDEVEQWLCFEDDEQCDCYGRPDGVRVDDRRARAAGCTAALDCCFVKDNGDGTYDCTCIATPPDQAGGAGAGGEGGAHVELSRESRCLVAAAMRNTPTVTPHCPPVTLDSPGVCALTFESCEPDYLKSNGLVACCDDLVCQADATGQKICSVPLE